MPALTAAREDEVRSKIELAAIALFVRKGFHGTRIREIATEAGMSVGGLYAHYQGKDGLFEAIVKRYQRLFASPDNPVLQHLASTRFPDDIPALAGAIRQLIEEHRDFWLLWYVDVLEFQGRHFGDRFLHDLQHPVLEARLAEVDRQGRLRVEARIAFRMVYMHVFNFLLVEILFGGRGHYGVPADQALEAITDVFLRGILASPSTS